VYPFYISVTPLLLVLADIHITGFPRHLHLHTERPPGHDLRYNSQIARAPPRRYRRAQPPRGVALAERHPRLHSQQPPRRMRVSSQHRCGSGSDSAPLPLTIERVQDETAAPRTRVSERPTHSANVDDGNDIYPQRHGMGDHKRAFSFATFYGLAELGNTTDRWAKKRRPGAVWESWERATRLGLGSEVGNCSTCLPVCICM
jgi:hypothetical protein